MKGKQENRERGRAHAEADHMWPGRTEADHLRTCLFRVVDALPVTKISKILSKFRRVMHINDESVSSDKGYN